MKDLIIIKTGSSFSELVSEAGDFEDWIISRLPEQAGFNYRIINVQKGEPLPDPLSVSGAVITGSHSMVTDHEEWSETTAMWIRDAAEISTPLLGICYGHQLLAFSMGGKVSPSPRGPEFGTIPLSLTAESVNDILFRGLDETIYVHTSHYQSVTELPEGSVVLASTEKDPNSAFRIGKCAWGVQFHPEYTVNVAETYLESYRKENLLHDRNCRNDEGRLSEIRCMETVSGEVILGNFADFLLSRK